MAIDNPYHQITRLYPDDDENGPVSAISKIFSSLTGLGIPVPSIFQFFTGLNTVDENERKERAGAFLRQLVHDIQPALNNIDRMKTEISEIRSAIRLGLQFDVTEFNDANRDRYISIVTRAIRSETKVHDLASYIRDVEVLGERDLIALRVLNKVMNRETDWEDRPGPPSLNPPKLHPNVFLQRAQELAVQMTHALKGDEHSTDGNHFSREDGLQLCLRLQGFGLAQEINNGPREVPIANYCARPTTRGLMLLKLLGEQVPNWDRYFDDDGPR